MPYTYTLRIHAPDETHSQISKILGQNPNATHGWAYQLEEKTEDAPIPFIDTFLDILEGKEAALKECGVGDEDIKIWMIYEYEGQCNMEFAPSDLKKLGEKGISLCISCYEAYTAGPSDN